LKNICLIRRQPQCGPFVSSKAGYSIDPYGTRNPKLQLFFDVSKINVSPSFEGLPVRPAPHVSATGFCLDKAGHSSDQSFSINPKIKLFLPA